MNGAYVALIVCGCVLFVAAVAAFVIFSNWGLTVTKYNLSIASAPEEGLKIVHLSDLHARNFGKRNRKLIKLVVAEKPDMIAFTGDALHKYRKRDLKVALYTVEGLCEIAPVYFVSGNHEMRSKKWREFKQCLEKSGAVVLDNDSASVCGVTVCGVNCADLKKQAPYEIANGKTGCKILLAHKPEYIARYAMAGYDLALCGHAHGGQWRFPFSHKGFFSPGQGLFPKYTEGVHSCGNMLEVISRGLGNSQCPLRLFNRPEIVVVNLKKE